MGDFALRHPHLAAQRAFERINTHSKPTMQTLTEDICAATGKDLDVRQIPQLGRWGAAALWMDLGDRHLILESQPASDHHNAWVRAHEFGHILFAHFGWVAPPEYASLTAGVGGLLEAARKHSVDFRRPAEQAAEEFARYTDFRIREAQGGILDSNYSVALS